jgi:transketolase
MMRDAFVARLTELAAANSRVFLVTGDLGFGVLTDFAERFPAQYLNCGVAEQNMTALATGIALEGRIVFTYSIANFPTIRCLEQIRNDAAYHSADVKLVAVGGGFSYGPLGMSHHATQDLAVMRSLPVVVVAPGCDWEAQEATEAIARRPGTCYLRLDKSGAGNTRRPDEQFVLGKARVLREGFDITLLSTGGILGVVITAAERLAEMGIECRVVSIHTIKPFDSAAVLTAAAETGGIVTVEEHILEGGLGSATAEALLDSGTMPRAFARLGIRDSAASDIGSQDFLRGVHGLDAHNIAASVMDQLKRANRERSNPGTAYEVELR